VKISNKTGRIGVFKPSTQNEAFLQQLNERLAEAPSGNARPTRPTIFVSGGPRSGTTFMAQALSQFLDVGFIDNLAARFWLAPVTGFRLSRTMPREEQSGDFSSHYGRTAAPGIHNFHYFWMHLLKLDAVADLFSPPAERSVSWGAIRHHLAGLQDAAGKPFLFKGYYPSYFMADFAREIPKSVFVIMHRAILPQALSLYRAREAFFGDPTAWLSLHPPEIESILTLPPEEQIVAQIVGLRHFFDDQVAQASGRLPVVHVDYDRLVEEPEPTLGQLAAEIEGITGDRVPTTGIVPAPKSGPKTSYPPDLVARMQRALAAI